MGTIALHSAIKPDCRVRKDAIRSIVCSPSKEVILDHQFVRIILRWPAGNMTMGLGRNNWQNSKAMTLRAAVINLCLGAIMQPAAAQNNPVGNLIGGILNAAVIQAVQAEWEQLPPLHGSCLRTELQKRGMALSALIQRGIGPFHASLAAIADPCVRLQEEADANLARQRKEEADRAAELRRQEQARLCWCARNRRSCRCCGRCPA